MQEQANESCILYFIWDVHTEICYIVNNNTMYCKTIIFNAALVFMDQPNHKFKSQQKYLTN